MTISTPKTGTPPAASNKQALKDRLWNIFGILFYLTIAVGAVYHLLLPLLGW